MLTGWQIDRHGEVAVWRRDNDPVVGEEGEPAVVFTVGKVGDFA